MSAMSDSDLLIERLLRVIDEGRRTATYKLALLLTLIDAVAETPGVEEIPTRVLAEKVFRLYWPQTRTFATQSGDAVVPRQIGTKNAEVIDTLLALRQLAATKKVESYHRLRLVLPTEVDAAIEAIETTFVKYPIPLLQVIGGTVQPFLYKADWPELQSLKKLRATGNDKIRLMPGVADRLVTLGPMLRPLIELQWVRDVAAWTKVALDEQRLHAHLFGTERVTFPKTLVAGLRELQHDECFYCGDQLTSPQVDHFLAWSRWPNDAIENLVLADKCNGHKSDYLAAEVHLTRWRTRLLTQAADLADLAEQTSWESAPAPTTGLIVSNYSHLAPGTPLWVKGKEFVTATGPLLG